MEEYVRLMVQHRTKTPLGVREMEDHVRPVLTSRVPTVRVLLSTLLQERINYFRLVYL